MKICSGDKWKEFGLRISELGTREYVLKCILSSSVPIQFELSREGRKEPVAIFLGYQVEMSDYVRFVVKNPIALMELEPYDRAAVDYALYLLNSDEMVEMNN